MILLRSRGLIRRPTEKPQQKPGLVARFWGVWNHTLSQWERRETPLFQHASLIRRPTATRCCEFSRPRCSNAVSLRRKEPLRPSLANDERKQLLLDLIVKPIGVRGSQHLARWRHRTRVALAVAYPSHDVIVVELHRFALSKLVRTHWRRTSPSHCELVHRRRQNPTFRDGHHIIRSQPQKRDAPHGWGVEKMILFTGRGRL